MNKGILYTTISAIAFSLGGLFIKLIPWSASSICGARCAISSIVIGLFFLLTKRKLIINFKTIIGAILVFLNIYTYVLANKLTTAANTIILEYTAPIYIIIFNLLLYKSKPIKSEIFVLICVFIGMIFVVIDGLSSGGMLGNLVAAINGVIYALVIMLNKFKGSDATSSTLLGHILTAILCMSSLVQETQVNSNVVLVVIALGIFQTGLGYFMLSIGTKYCEPLTASLIECIEPVLNPILVLVFYGETMSLYTLLGITLVLGSIIIYDVRLIKLAKD